MRETRAALSEVVILALGALPIPLVVGCAPSWVGLEGELGIPLLLSAVVFAVGIQVRRRGFRTLGTLAAAVALPALVLVGFLFLFFVVLGASR